MKKSLLIILFAFILIPVSFTQAQVKWIGIEEAHKATQSKIKKKVFVDVYTDWCGWCVRMDKTTFEDSIVAKILNKYYYPVKLNAESADDITIGTTTYKNLEPGKKRSAHQLAAILLNGKMGYPSFVILSEEFKSLSILPGYREARDFEKILWYYYNDDYSKYSFEEYEKIYEKEIRPKMLKKLR